MVVRLRAVPGGPVYVIGYVRVSTAREEMISPEIQEQAIRDLCARRGWTLIKIIYDLDATGRNFARKGVQEAIGYVESGQAHGVAVWKFNRFGRNRKGWAINLDRVESVGGFLESATEDVDAGTSTGKFTRGMFAEVAAWESDRIGDQWKETHEHRRSSGLPHSGGPRFGYVYHRATVTTRFGVKICPQGCAAGECKTKYVPDPDVADAAAEIYRRYNAGDPCRSIALWLNDRMLRTAKGGLWDETTVRRYMDSGFAAGLVREHDNRCPCKSPMTCDRVAFHPGTHKALIDMGAWETYQRNRKRRRSNAPRVESPVYPLAGLVRCEHCKGAMTAVGSYTRNGTYRKGYEYRCAKRARAGKTACPGASIARHRVESFVLDWLAEIAAAEIDADPASRVVREATRVVARSDRERLRRQAQDLAAALTRLTVNHAKRMIPDATYEAARDEMSADQAKIQQTLDEMDDELANHMTEEHVQVAEGLVAEWPTLSVASKREMLSKLVTRIEIGDKIDVTPVWDDVT